MFGGPRISFVVYFVALYAIMHTAYFHVPDAALAELYRWAINEPAAWVINAFGAEPPVTVDGHRLMSPLAVLEIVRGCDGAGVVFITSAAILAFGASWPSKLLGVLLGTALIYVLNQARVIVLYFVVVHEPDWFLPLHTYYIPTLIVVVASLYFLAWLNFAAPHEAPEPAAA